MKDRIIAAYLNDFQEQFGLTGLDESQAFEYFVNYYIISKHYPGEFDPEDVAVGGGGDLGLDGIGILVNDHLALSRTDVDYFKKSLRRLDVQFIFIQAKTSSRFEVGDIGSFISGVRQFFDTSKPIGVHESILERHALMEHVFGASRDMIRSPLCRMYYATTGTWTDEPALQARIDQGKADLKRTNLFSAVEFVPLDAEALKRVYRELSHGIEREIVFEKHTILPMIEGVEEAYIGIVPCAEYLKLILTDEDELNRRLFYDNVRDFQGNNPVNTEIQETVRDSARSDRFALLNNGVTVVARDVHKVGTRFCLKDYQIVNGCQTSHILYINRDKLTDRVYVPLKLVVTADAEVTNQVIQGTNRQTEVKLEAFESIKPFQKELEEFYLALGRDRKDPLVYERRSKQYEYLQIPRERIISLATQVKCFVAVFFNEPHSTHRYYGELLSSYQSRLFSDSHSKFPYFVSGAAYACLERLFYAGRLPRSWKAWRQQLLMLFRLQNEPSELPPLNSRAIDTYCEALLAILEDPAKCENAFTRAGQLVESTQKRMEPWREPPERTKVFTSELIKAASGGRDRQPATTVRVTGTVKWFSDVKGYGFIIRDDSTAEVFVHHTGIIGAGYRSLFEGQRVSLAIAPSPRGVQAVDVAVI